MIKCVFHTNLDLAHGDKCQWPEELAFRPVVGDYIRSSYVHPGRYVYDTGDHDKPRTVGKGFQLELIVVRVMIITQNKEGWNRGNFERLDVELHLPPDRYTTLRDFYDHYELITGRKFI